ncbi:MAG: Rpn family recombination-promoting nuclease/putative transposase, partial [Bacteroidales bacterium]|nr:Rpn family recombination-promoting nuclease/putative transposase [Bacteroidales bacterium]
TRNGKLKTMNDKPIIGRYARIIMDDWFKRTFGTEPNKGLLIMLLKELIPEHDIKDLTYVQQEHINPFPGKKDALIDVECVDTDGTRFIVEMQVARQRFFYERSLFYSTFGIQQQVEKSSSVDYRFPPVYFVGFMDFSLHEGSDRVLYRYSLRENETGEEMTGSLQFVFLELTNCRKALTPKATLLDNFCYALHNMEHLTDRPEELKEEIFKRLFKTAEIATFTPEERIKYENDMTTERDIQNYISYAREKGLEEGMEKGLLEAARNMLAEGFSIDLVVKCTGLSVEQVKELKL